MCCPVIFWCIVMIKKKKKGDKRFSSVSQARSDSVQVWVGGWVDFIPGCSLCQCFLAKMINMQHCRLGKPVASGFTLVRNGLSSIEDFSSWALAPVDLSLIKTLMWYTQNKSNFHHPVEKCTYMYPRLSPRVTKDIYVKEPFHQPQAFVSIKDESSQGSH